MCCVISRTRFNRTCPSFITKPNSFSDVNHLTTVTQWPHSVSDKQFRKALGNNRNRKSRYTQMLFMSSPQVNSGMFFIYSSSYLFEKYLFPVWFLWCIWADESIRIATRGSLILVFSVDYSWQQEPRNRMSLILSHWILTTSLWGKYNVISSFTLYFCTYLIRTSEVRETILNGTEDTKMWSLLLWRESYRNGSSHTMWWGLPSCCREDIKERHQVGKKYLLYFTDNRFNEAKSFPKFLQLCGRIIILNPSLQIPNLPFFVQH